MSPAWVFLLLFIPSLVSLVSYHLIVNTIAGDDVTLPCRGPSVGHEARFRWTRTTDGLTFLTCVFKGENVTCEGRSGALSGRVELRDASSMKDGDFSVVLLNVDYEDTGTYECRIKWFLEGHYDVIECFINLRVRGETALEEESNTELDLVLNSVLNSEPGSKLGYPIHYISILSAVGVLVLVVLVVLTIVGLAVRNNKSIRDSNKGRVQLSQQLSESKGEFLDF